MAVDAFTDQLSRLFFTDRDRQTVIKDKEFSFPVFRTRLKTIFNNASLELIDIGKAFFFE